MIDDAHPQLLARLESRQAQIGIVGLGYVGLPLARAFCRAGFPVLGIDVDPERVAELRRGESPIRGLDSEELSTLVTEGRFEPTTEFKALRRAEVAILCVPTPLTPARDPDLSHVENATESVRRYMNPGTLVVLESTTYPGTTEEVVLPALEESGLEVEEGFFLAYSPEREDPGNPDFSTENTPKLVGGVGPRSTELATALYSNVVQEVLPVSDARTAEAAKILENIYRAVNIALVNELKVLFDRMDIDVWEVIAAASTKPFGYQPFYPGPGLGGHCIPIDPFYLTWRARKYGMPTRFIELAGEINTVMPEYVVSRLMDAVNERGRAVKNASVLILGVAYKRDVGDVRESPALRLISLLSDKGARVSYHDPHVPSLRAGGGLEQGMESVPLTPEVLRSADVVLLVTDHTAVDYSLIAEHADLVVDTRNVMAAYPEANGNVVRA